MCRRCRMDTTDTTGTMGNRGGDCTRSFPRMSRCVGRREKRNEVNNTIRRKTYSVVFLSALPSYRIIRVLQSRHHARHHVSAPLSCSSLPWCHVSWMRVGTQTELCRNFEKGVCTYGGETCSARNRVVGGVARQGSIAVECKQLGGVTSAQRQRQRS